MSRPPLTADQHIATLRRQGWCPVRWAHHPPEIKAELRRLGLAPQLKQCYMNCQKLILRTHLPDLEYWEGWSDRIIPFDHAWLLWRGEIIDLTLEPETKYPVSNYRGYMVPRDEVLQVLRRGWYGPLRHQQQLACGPWGTLYAELESQRGQQTHVLPLGGPG